ncbi:GtrA family protein [Paenibacillus sp. FSL P4-0338]|uniref:GtrA family protein n=1 Tax=Paenibacillus sp. FSL P4-0338 TaxID=2921635 RepID=UPI0030F5B638
MDNRSIYGEKLQDVLEFIKYSFWGAVTTAINLLIFFLLENLGIHYIIANILSYICAVLLNYILNKKFVFNNQTLKNKESSQLLKFFAVRLSALLIDNILFYLLVSGLHYNVNISRIGLSFLIIIATYGVNKFFVFNTKKR